MDSRLIYSILIRDYFNQVIFKKDLYNEVYFENNLNDLNAY